MPQRFLRPEIRNSHKWNSVQRVDQVLYISLITLVDDFGQYDARASVIWGACFAVWNDLHPEDRVEVAAVSCGILRLTAAGLIEIYETESGKTFLQLTNWQERVRAGAIPKWGGKGKILRNPAESCGILPPSPSPSPSPIAIASAPPDTQNTVFKIPTMEEVKNLFVKTGLPSTEAEKFFYFYESKGWMVGKSKMKSLAGAVGGWAARNRDQANRGGQQQQRPQPKYDPYSSTCPFPEDSVEAAEWFYAMTNC